MICISSNHYSVDQQAMDCVSYIKDFMPEVYERLASEVHEIKHVEFSMSSFHVEAMGVDSEWPQWLVEFIERETPITWYEGEPVIYEDGDEVENDFCAVEDPGPVPGAFTVCPF